MKKKIIFVMTLLLFSGCQHLIGVQNQKSELVVVGGEVNKQQFEDLKKLINDENASTVIGEKCIIIIEEPEQPYDKSAVAIAIAVPLITAGAKLLFDLYMDYEMEKLKDLKKAAQRTYSAKIVLPADKFMKNCNCVILKRYKNDESRAIGMIAVVKINKQDKNDSFTVQPIYVRAYNSLALTAEKGSKKKEEEDSWGEESKTPEKKKYAINVSIGASVKSIGVNDYKIPGVFSLGEGVVSIPDLLVGNYAKNDAVPLCVNEECPSSDIIPYPVNPDSTASVSLSITETGDVGIDFDQTEAELKAMKAAIGPALEKSLIKYLEKE